MTVMFFFFFLPIIGCRQHGEVYFQLNITLLPLIDWSTNHVPNGLLLNESKVYQLHLGALRHHSLGSIRPAGTPFHSMWEASCSSLREIFRSQPWISHLHGWSLEACCSQACWREHWSAVVFPLPWIPENLNHLLSVQNKDHRGLTRKQDFIWFFIIFPTPI